MRDGIGAIIEDRPGQHPHVNKAGFVLGDEIGLLVNRGFQMFWKSPSGRTAPALATHLKALHAFEEDLKEGLGLPSLYNESLGTTSDLHLVRPRPAPRCRAMQTSPGNINRSIRSPKLIPAPEQQ